MPPRPVTAENAGGPHASSTGSSGSRANSAIAPNVPRLHCASASAISAARQSAAVVAPVMTLTSSGRSARAVPIMESRVTRSASLSSLQPSVPAGRIGSTMKRVSAVESHTRISVSFGSVTPKSSSTPRGSFTARER